MSHAPATHLDPRVLAKIARLELRAKGVVEGFVTGLHQSPYHGFAVEFANHRPYVPGDEPRHIDWRVWARQDRLYIKEYEEETNLRCTVILDASKSMAYGPAAAGMTKFDYAATCAASLLYLLHRQQDAVGLVTFDTQIRRHIPATAQAGHYQLIMHELESARPDRATDVGQVFHTLAQALGRRGMVALVSDLLVDPDTLHDALRRLRHRRHEVVVFHVLHDDELTFPFQDPTRFVGLEQTQELTAEPAALRRAYLENLQRRLTWLRKTCDDLAIDYVLLSTHQPLDAALSAYLLFRQRLSRAGARAGVRHA